jgi:hypothetical protein
MNYINPFIFIRNKCRVLSSEGFSALEKNAAICTQRAVLPFHAVGYIYIIPVYIKMAIWRTFFEVELAGSGVEARCRL